MTKEERKQHKFESFCCKMYWIGCLCESLFSSIFLRLMDTNALIAGWFKIKSFDWLREQSGVNFKCCMQRRRKKLPSHQTSFQFAIWHAMPCRVTPPGGEHTNEDVIIIIIIIHWLSLKPKLFASKTFYYVIYGFHVITFVESHLLFRFRHRHRLPLYFIQFNLIFCTFLSKTRSCSRQAWWRWRWQNEKIPI